MADLPGDASRLIQRANGYVATVKAGEVTFVQGEDTGARPGRLLAAPGDRPHRCCRRVLGTLYERDWARIGSFFGPDSIYYDVPTGPATAARGPATSRPGSGSASSPSPGTSTDRARSRRGRADW